MNEAVPELQPSASRTRRRWFRKRGIDLGDLAVNSFAAFLGVFIALTVQNWRDDHDKREKLSKARTAIHAEILRNRDRVRERLDYQRLIRSNGAAIINGTMAPVADRSYANDEAVRKAADKIGFTLACGRIPGYKGFAVPTLTRAAYDAAVAAGVTAQMDIDENERIAAAYAAQIEYGRAFDRQSSLLQRLYDSDNLFTCVLIADEETYYSLNLLQAYGDYLGEPVAP